MADDKVKRLIDFRKRTYALLSMQSSLEGSSIVDIVEKAVESYVNPTIKEIVNAEYGEYEERAKTKRSGRPKVKKDKVVKEEKKDKVVDKVVEEKKESKDTTSNLKKDDEVSVTSIEDDLTDEERDILGCYS